MSATTSEATAAGPTVAGTGPQPMPAGFQIMLDPATRVLPCGALLGGSPMRVMRLTAAGRQAMTEISGGPLLSVRARRLARRLTDAGLAHPRPGPATGLSLTVLVPVRDRAEELDRCLAALGSTYPVVVVDDGSRDPGSVRRVAADHGVKVLRRNSNGGPAAARNTALAQIDTEYVALLDSDCTAPPDWIARLAGHLADPDVALAAPRIVPASADRSARRYAAVCGALDLGIKEARVAPLGPVAYVPTAALVLRRSALLEVARDGEVFDESMRYGEDVDLVWRLHAAGWRMRFDPSVTVAHREPATWSELLRRRFCYGTSAAPLAHRHPGLVTPAVLRPLPLATIAAAVTGHAGVAAAAFTAGAGAARRTLRAAGVREPRPIATNARLLGATWVGLSRYLTQFAAPVVVMAAVLPGRHRSRRVALAAAVLLSPAAETWRTRGPALNPALLAVGSVADHVAYGAGVWTSAIRARSLSPVLPTIA